MRSWFIYFLLFLNAILAVLNPALAAALGTFDGFTVLLMVGNLVGAGLMLNVLRQNSLPPFS